MKRLLVFCTAIMMMATIATVALAYEGSYGVTPDGVYYVSADLVKTANGSVPKLLAAPSFKPEAMKLEGNYYIFASGKKLRAGAKTDFCFDVGNGQYIPHALIGDARIKAEDAADNGVGGYNFRMAPK